MTYPLAVADADADDDPADTGPLDTLGAGWDAAMLVFRRGPPDAFVLSL
jgi:hypothetical protein